MFTTTPLEYAVEPICRSAFRSLKIRIPRPIATGFTKTADDKMALSRGMQSFQISAAKHVNRLVSARSGERRATQA